MDYDQYQKVMKCVVPEEEKAQFENYTNLDNIKESWIGKVAILSVYIS